MKTNIIAINILIAILLFTGCLTEKSVDFKATIVAQKNNSAASPDDLNKSARIIDLRLADALDIPQERIKSEVIENQILLTISRIDINRIDQIRNMITGRARLEFWETYENKEIIGDLSAANKALKTMKITGDSTNTNFTKSESDQAVKAKDTLEKTNVANRVEFKENEPLFGILSPRISLQGDPLPSCMVGVVAVKDTSEVNRYLNLTGIKALFPPDLKFYWSQKAYKYDTSRSLYELHAIKVTTPDGQAPLNGSVITSAKVIEGPRSSDVKIDFTMNDEGAGKWATITRENINRCIAVVLNGYVRSYPRVMNEISGGKTEITGDFTLTEARDLVSMLNSGAMPCDLKIVEEKIIKRE